MEPEDLMLGRTAYEAYCAYTKGVSAVTGAPLPDFYDTSDGIRQAWAAAAAAVQSVLKETA